MLSLRLSPVRQRRSTVGNDITTLIAALGGDSAVPALYDVRAGVSATGALVDAWSDARGGTGGPALLATGGARPTIDATGVIFDGVATYLRATGGTLAALADPLGLFLVLVPPAVQTAANRRLAVLSTGATEMLRPYAIASTANYGVIGAPATNSVVVGALVGLSGTRVVMARRTLTDTAGEIGANAEVSFAAASNVAAVDTLTVAAGSGVAANFAGFTLRAIGVTRGVSGAQWSTIQAWAAANHGATL